LEKLNEEGGNAQIIEQLTDKRGADREAYLRELQEKLNEALQKLSIPHRTVITLFEIDGLSHAEIADVMDCSEGTVRSRLHYAKQFLQGELGKYLGS
jgi:RNA polymerase sigma factor (sigma-70 family)